MKSILISISILCYCYMLPAQTTSYPKGAYKSFTELINRTPSIPYDGNFIIHERSANDIKMTGGSDYKVSSKTYRKSTIYKGIFAISTGETLYLNCYFHHLQKGYTKVISEGKFLVFFGPLSKGDAARFSAQENTIGAANGAVTGAKLATMRNLYILDTTYSLAKSINRGRLSSILESRPDLLRRYNLEQEKNDIVVMLRYLMVINEE